MTSTRLERRIQASSHVLKSGLSKVMPSFRGSKKDELLLELPQHLELMAAKLASGQTFIDVLSSQSQIATGRVAVLLTRLCKRLEFGASLETALNALAQEAESPSVSEFANRVQISLVRGSPLADQVALLADSTRTKFRIQLLRKAGKNELLMLVPLVFLILPVTIGFAVFPSLQLLRLGL